MEKNFDFNRVGKRTPYQVPDDFFDSMEQKVLNEVSKESLSEPQRTPFARSKGSFWTLKRTLLATAAVAVVLLVMTFQFVIKPQPSATEADVELAFDNLDTEDQDFLLAVYSEDVFLEEQ